MARNQRSTLHATEVIGQFACAASSGERFDLLALTLPELTRRSTLGGGQVQTALGCE
ncbi:MAG: hypothetical protein ABTD50_21615 [Polyangiaceae bacterium]